jgi:hypothetical protein
MLTSTHSKLTRRKMLDCLAELETAGGQAMTIYLPAGISQADASVYLKQVPPLAPALREITAAVTASQNGAAIFWGQATRRLILPPFPLADRYVSPGYDVGPLKALLSRDYRIGIILVRLGSYSIGVCQGEELVDHKTGTGLVHGRQRQGGSSSARFQRRRQNEARDFLERVAAHAEEKLAPYANTLDYVVFGGAHTAIQVLRKSSRLLSRFDSRLLPPLLTLPEPRYEVLERAVTEIWSSRLTEWSDDKR